MQTLILTKRGCDFGEWDVLERKYSDVGNFRITTEKQSIIGKDGRDYFLQFSLYRNKGHNRTISKRDGKPLKKAVFEVDIPCALHIDTQYEEKDESGCLLSWRNLKLEEQINAKDYKYTLADILTVVNEISIKQYDKIEFEK